MQKCQIVLQDEHDDSMDASASCNTNIPWVMDEVQQDASASCNTDVPWVMDEVPQDASASCNMDESNMVCVICWIMWSCHHIMVHVCDVNNIASRSRTNGYTFCACILTVSLIYFVLSSVVSISQDAMQHLSCSGQLVLMFIAGAVRWLHEKMQHLSEVLNFHLCHKCRYSMNTTSESRNIRNFHMPGTSGNATWTFSKL